MMLKNKKILIAGLANKHSIAAGIAKAMHAQGAELAFTYQSERLKSNVEKIANELGSTLLFECDVASDESIDAMYKGLSNHWKTFDGFVHSIGFAPANIVLNTGSLTSVKNNSVVNSCSQNCSIE